MLATIALNAAYVALVAASLTRLMVGLRLFMVVASACFIAFAILSDLPSMILWNIAIGGSHAFFLGRIFLASRHRLEAESEAVAVHLFPSLTAQERFVLWDVGVEERHQNVALTVEGIPVDRTMLLLAGAVEVRQQGQPVEWLQPNELIDSAVDDGHAAFSTAVAVGPVTIRSWSIPSVNALAHKHPHVAREFHAFVRRDITAKLRSATRRLAGELPA